MPKTVGKWTYVTHSSLEALDSQQGSFECVSPSTGNHGPVVVDGRYAFKYADGTRYYPIGTTAYDWMHVSADMQKLTVKSLSEARFNK